MNFLELALLYSILTIVAPILFFYLRAKLIKKLKGYTYKEKQEKALIREREMSHLEKETKDYYLIKTQPLYLEARDLFNSLMKNRALSRNEILYLKNLINKQLGAYVDHYKTFKFKNDCQEIYTKMKCQHLDAEDFTEIIQYLNECKNIRKTS